MGSSEVVKDAYYLHPLLQIDEMFKQNKDKLFEGVNTEALLLATEYRRLANSYLSARTRNDFVGFSYT